MANDGALESSQQREFDLGLLAGGRHNYKNNNLVQGKQTVSPKYPCDDSKKAGENGAPFFPSNFPALAQKRWLQTNNNNSGRRASSPKLVVRRARKAKKREGRHLLDGDSVSSIGEIGRLGKMGTSCHHYRPFSMPLANEDRGKLTALLNTFSVSCTLSVVG